MGASCSRASPAPAAGVGAGAGAGAGAGGSDAPLSPQAMTQELEALQAQHDRTQEALRAALVTLASGERAKRRSDSSATTGSQTSSPSVAGSRNLSRNPSRSRNSGSRRRLRAHSSSQQLARRHSERPHQAGMLSSDEVAGFNHWFQTCFQPLVPSCSS